MERFSDDFMFRLNKEEVTLVKSQFVTSRNGFFKGQEGGNRKLTYILSNQEKRTIPSPYSYHK